MRPLILAALILVAALPARADSVTGYSQFFCRTEAAALEFAEVLKADVAEAQAEAIRLAMIGQCVLTRSLVAVSGVRPIGKPFVDSDGNLLQVWEAEDAYRTWYIVLMKVDGGA